MQENPNPQQDNDRVIPSYNSLEEVGLDPSHFLFRGQDLAVSKFLGKEYIEKHAIKVAGQTMHHPSLESYADAVETKYESLLQDEKVTPEKRQEFLDRSSLAFSAELDAFTATVDIDMIIRLNDRKPEGYEQRIEGKIRKLYEDAQVADVNMQALKEYVKILKNRGLALSERYTKLYVAVAERTVAVIDALLAVKGHEDIDQSLLDKFERIEDEYKEKKGKIGPIY